MDFLKHIAFSQSLEHIGLLHLAINIVYALFVPYVSVLFVSMIIAVTFERRGLKSGNEMSVRFARELTQSVIPNKSSLLLFGVLPFFAVLLGYAQLLQDSPDVAVSTLFVSFLLFSAGALCLYAYAYTFRLNEILSIATSAGPDEALDQYAKENIRFHANAGMWGVVLVTLSQFLFELAVSASTKPWEVTTLWDALISPESYARMGQALSFAGMLTGAAILYLFFAGKHTEESEYTQFVKKFSITLSLLSTLAAPLFILLILAAFPQNGLTGSVFGITALVLIMLFAAGHFFYAMLKSFSTRLAANALFILTAALILAVIKDQIAFGSATRIESARLAARYDKENQALLDKMGLGAAPLTGEEIFTGRCSACHTFTEKKVGPPYKETLPKYENKRDELVAFILNPKKMNPAFPPMPNQGLKPAEADSIAAYIMKTYKQK
ncbi:MAG TPA: cytochrome c [Bacteroidota bacterium]|nr:cytochrome c [Bacteroidota bacterium]